MALFDLPLAELRAHTTDLTEPADLDEFWSSTLAEARQFELAASFVPTPSPLRSVESFDVTFSGFAGQPVRGWFHLPVRTHTDTDTGDDAGDQRLPCVVEYVGYSGGRGLVHERTFWASCGFAHLVMDTRGQGSGSSIGVTADVNDGDPASPGVMTRGILDPRTYYYRRLFTDAVRAVEAARTHPSVDASRVAVAGASQGGAMSLAAAALVGDVAAVLSDVPFLCDIRRACGLTDATPYNEIGQYLKAHRDQVESVFATLRYFDCALLASRVTPPALFSVGLMDVVCPPSTVYAAFNACRGPKQIREYEYNDHEGGGAFHDVVRVDWLRELLGA